MPEECAQIRLVSSNEDVMSRATQKKVVVEEDGSVSESGQLTWIYRGVIGLLVAIVLGLVAWEGQNISNSVGQVKTDIFSLKADMAAQIGSLKTDYATTGVIRMGLQNQVGEANGKLVATADRFNRLGDMINMVRDRLTILETKYDDHVKTTNP